GVQTCALPISNLVPDHPWGNLISKVHACSACLAFSHRSRRSGAERSTRRQCWHSVPETQARRELAAGHRDAILVLVESPAGFQPQARGAQSDTNTGRHAEGRTNELLAVVAVKASEQSGSNTNVRTHVARGQLRFQSE